MGIVKDSEKKYEFSAIGFPVVWSQQSKHSLWLSDPWAQKNKIGLDNENWTARYSGHSYVPGAEPNPHHLVFTTASVHRFTAVYRGPTL